MLSPRSGLGLDVKNSCLCLDTSMASASGKGVHTTEMKQKGISREAVLKEL